MSYAARIVYIKRKEAGTGRVSLDLTFHVVWVHPGPSHLLSQRTVFCSMKWGLCICLYYFIGIPERWNTYQSAFQVENLFK